MSAGALLISDREIHLMSDGIMSYKDGDSWQVESRNINKVKAINDRCALLWLGAGILQIWERVQADISEHTLGAPWEVARCVSQNMKDFYETHNIDMGGRVRVVGFQQRTPVVYEITSYDKFEIRKQDIPLGGVYAWAMIHGTNNNNIYPELAGKYLKKGYDLQQVAKAAWRETVNHYQEKDVTIGGATFHHSLSLAGGATSTATAGFEANDSL